MFYFQTIWKVFLLPFALGLLVSVSASAVDYQTTVTLPACDVGNPKVLIIDEASDFSQINHEGKTIFCVEPGAYAVDLFIRKSGTAEQRRYIIYHNTSETSEVHPALMAVEDRASVDGLRWDGKIFTADTTGYWTVSRLTVDGTGDRSIRMPKGTHDLILDRMLVENSGGSGQIATGGNNLVVQNSVIRNSKVTPDYRDDHCLALNGGDNVKIVGNEMYNCAGDMIQLHVHDMSNTVVADNELYVTSAYYTDCSGNFDTEGACMCVENGLDLKEGGLGAFPYDDTQQFLIVNNRIWGFNRDDDDGNCTTGAGNVGLAIVSHINAEGIVFKDNVVTDSQVGWIFANETTSHVSYINNLWYDLETGISAVLKSSKHEFYYNTFLKVDKWFQGNENTLDVLCNVLIDVLDDGVTTIGASSKFDFNAFYNSDETDVGGNTNDESYTTAAESNNDQFCWTRHFITNPTQVCVSLAATSTASPHADICTGTTETATRGINDITQLTRLQGGFLPLSEFFLVTIDPADYDTDPGVSYTFTAPKKGIYQFWFQATTTSESTNSISYSVGGRPKQIVSFTYPATTWVKGDLNLNLNAGLQTLTVFEREAGIVIDKITITNNPNFTILSMQAESYTKNTPNNGLD